MTPAPQCSGPECRRRTRDSSGRCHDHRSDRSLPVSSWPEGSLRITHLDSGSRIETWRAPDGFHRLDGPAKRRVRGDGSVEWEEWWFEGWMHRDGAPAAVSYHYDGSVADERWYVHGQLSRMDGPAEVFYDPDGNITRGEFYVCNVSVPLTDDLYLEIGRILLTSRVKTRTRVLRSSPYGDLIGDGRRGKAIAQAFIDGVHTVDGVRALLDGAPIEWVRAYETGAQR